MVEHIIHRIILLLSASKNADFMAEQYYIHRIILLLNASKNADFMTEHKIMCHVVIKKQQKCCIMTEHIIPCLLLNASKTADFMAKHIVGYYASCSYQKQSKMPISWWSIRYIASHCYRMATKMLI